LQIDRIRGWTRLSCVQEQGKRLSRSPQFWVEIIETLMEVHMNV